MNETIQKFEKAIAEFYGARYAVATDCCTHAIELALRYTQANNVTCPSQTNISIPLTFIKLGLKWQFVDELWQDHYTIGNTNIVDAAVYWKENGYIPGTFMCLSFQFKKHLNLIRGGAILFDDPTHYDILKKMSYDGRSPDQEWRLQNIDTMGYHYYMPPETAQLGLDKLPDAIARLPKKIDYSEYPYLPNMKVFE